MKKLLATTALGLMMAMPALADNHAAPAGAMATETFYGAVDHAVMASDLIGKRVYATETDYDPNAALTEIDGNWDDIGEVSDVIIGLQGDVEAVLVDIGGFLGIGEKTVAVNLGTLAMIPDGDSEGEFFIVMKGNRAALEGAPAYSADMDHSDASGAMEAAETRIESAAAETRTTMDEAMQSAEAVAKDAAAKTEAMADATAGTVAAMTGPRDISALTAEDLTGESVWGPDGDRVGEVGEVVLDDQMKVSGIVIDVGGFLGIGEKPVELSPEMVQVTSDDAGVTLNVALTEAELEQLPEFQG